MPHKSSRAAHDGADKWSDATQDVTAIQTAPTDGMAQLPGAADTIFESGTSSEEALADKARDPESEADQKAVGEGVSVSGGKFGSGDASADETTALVHSEDTTPAALVYSADTTPPVVHSVDTTPEVSSNPTPNP